MKYLYWCLALVSGISALVYAFRMDVEGLRFSCIVCLLFMVLSKLEETE